MDVALLALMTSFHVDRTQKMPIGNLAQHVYWPVDGPRSIAPS